MAGIDPFASLTAAILDLLTRDGDLFLTLGTNLFRGLAVILVAWFGIRAALTSAEGGPALPLGAFATAKRAGCPVVPAIIQGSRVALSPRGGLPHPVPLRIEILDPVIPTALEGNEAVAALCRQARNAILGRLQEPDREAA